MRFRGEEEERRGKKEYEKKKRKKEEDLEELRRWKGTIRYEKGRKKRNWKRE
jgi:hypothetical protein